MKEHPLKLSAEGRKRLINWDKWLDKQAPYLIGFVTGSLFAFPIYFWLGI